jgi:hypothetical protein
MSENKMVSEKTSFQTIQMEKTIQTDKAQPAAHSKEFKLDNK